jgi:hypothetical protein
VYIKKALQRDVAKIQSGTKTSVERAEDTKDGGKFLCQDK